MTETYPNFDRIQSVHQQLTDMRLDYWISHNLFTFQWWLLLCVLIFPWFIWWRFVDKQRITEILLFGAILAIFVILMDDFGVEKHLWSYPYQLVNVIPRLIPIDLGILIVAHMFVYQYFSQWKKFILANLIMACIFTFIFEPFTVWLGVYRLENWEHIYSLPIYVLKAVFIKWVMEKLILQQKI